MYLNGKLCIGLKKLLGLSYYIFLLNCMLGLSFVNVKWTWNATSWVELRISHSKSKCFPNWATKLSCLPPTFAKKYLNNLELFYSQSWYTNIFSVVCTWYNFCNSMRKSHCHLLFPWLQIFPFWHIFLSSPKYKEGETVVTWLSKGRKKKSLVLCHVKIKF